MRFLTRTETHLINSKYVLWSVRRSSRRQDNKKKGGGTYGCLQFVEEKKVHCFVELSDFVDNSGCLWEFLEIILIYLFWYFCLELNRKMTLQVFVATWLSIIVFYSLEMIKPQLLYLYYATINTWRVWHQSSKNSVATLNKCYQAASILFQGWHVWSVVLTCWVSDY